MIEISIPNNHELAFGERLKKIRTERNVSLRELAKVINIDHSYVAKMEKGQYPSIPVLFRISEYFKINPSYLLNGNNAEELLGKWLPIIEMFEEKEVKPEEVIQFFSMIKKIAK